MADVEQVIYTQEAPPVPRRKAVTDGERRERRRESMRRWRARNPEKAQAAQSAATSRRDRTKDAAYKKEWHIANREVLCAAARARYATQTPEQRVARNARKRELKRARPPERRANDAAKNRNGRLARRYGLTAPAFEAMVLAQGGLCALCGTQTQHLCVDHCHATGVVRGLLCSPCNQGLGQFRDNTEVMERAIVYLRERGR